MNAGQDKSISIYQTYFVCLFLKPILTRQIISKNSQEFLASRQVSVLRRNKAKNSGPVILMDHFSPALKALVLGNLFKVFRRHHTVRTESLPLGDKDEENMTIV